MPVTAIRIGKGRPFEKKRALVSEMTKIAAETLDVRPERVPVLIEE
jgi:4-oxalocrotonate tautomerase